jgi:hypothetical protein
MTKEIITILLGSFSAAMFLSCLILSYFLCASTYLYKVSKRDKGSIRTPEKFDWFFFWKDNGPALILHIFMIPFLIRFTPEIAQYAGFNLFQGMSPILIAIAVGLCVDWLMPLIFEKFGKSLKGKASLSNTTTKDPIGN